MLKIHRLLLTASTLLFALNAQAGNAYLQLEAGQSRSDINISHFEAFNNSIEAAGGSARFTENKTDTALIIGVGYEYSPHFAVEVSYLNLGEASACSETTDTAAGITRHRTIKESVEQDALMLSLIGQLPLTEQWQLRGSLGLAWLDQASRGEASGVSRNNVGTVMSETSESTRQSSHEWVLALGLGVGYQFKPEWQLQLNWRRLLNTAPALLGKQNVDVITAGVSYRF